MDRQGFAAPAEEVGTAKLGGGVSGGRVMNVGTIPLVILRLMLNSVLPAWLRSVRWGYFQSGGVGVAYDCYCLGGHRADLTRTPKHGDRAK